MNPDTKATPEQIKAVCTRHNITYHSHSRITVGFSHELHRINDNLVLKIYNSLDSRPFKTELALLASDLPFLKPKLIAVSENSEDIDRSYVIMTYVPGVPLGSKWHEASDGQRDKLIQAISQTLKTINQIDPHAIAEKAPSEWDDLILERGKTLTAELQSKGIINSSTTNKVLKTIRQNLDHLTGSKLLPVYWDVHFDNFLVNDDFELQAIIDLENVELAALDYPLFVIEKMTDEPGKYLTEENERYADKKDYANLKSLYKKYYPEMFAFDHLDSRVRLYQLVDVLHLLTDWPQVKELYVKLDDLTA